MQHAITLIAATTAVAALTASAFAQTAITNSHADIGIAYEGGTWDLHIHDEDTDAEYEPDEAFFLAQFPGFNATQPNDSNFNFIGAGAGNGFFLLQNSPQPGLPYIGWATEEVEAGVFTGNLSLNLVGARGPGEMSVFSSGVGTVTPVFTTSNGIDASDVMTLPVGTHVHYNIAFTEVGRYEIDVVASGPTAGGTLTSDVATYSFVVVPEPASLGLLGLGGLGLVRRRR